MRGINRGLNHGKQATDRTEIGCDLVRVSGGIPVFVLDSSSRMTGGALWSARGRVELGRGPLVAARARVKLVGLAQLG